MTTVKVELGERSYEIVVGSGVLARAGSEISAVCRGKTAIIVTEPTVGRLYAGEASESLISAGFKVAVAEIPGGEDRKNLATTSELYDKLLDAHIDRTGVLVTLGGGVVGDLGGFVAATYLRGIDFVQIPTTLLAQVDASIGGKVGVDLPRGKNLVGAFYQPKRVLIDPDVLSTLPRRELSNGLAEVIKHGIIADQELFDFLRSETKAVLALERNTVEKLITRSCKIKAGVVASDERESIGKRAILNFGHTVGHGIEAATGFAKYAHGEAVSIGMVNAALISEAKGMADKGIAQEIASLLTAYDLPVAPAKDVDIDLVVRAVAYDKKVMFGKLRFVLLRRIGEVELVDNVTETDVRAALAEQMKSFGE